MNESQTANAVAAYDFRRPVRLSRRLRAQFDALHARAARPLGDAVAERLETACQATYRSATEVPSDQLFATAYDPVYMLTTPGTNDQVLVRLATPLAQACVDRLLGGLGQGRPVDREPTEIEARLLALVVGKLRGVVRKELAAHLPEGGVQFLGAAERHAIQIVPGVAAEFTVQMAEAEGLLQLFYSFDGMAEGLLASAAPEESEAAAASGPAKLEWPSVTPVPVAVRAQLRPTSISIRDLAALQVGDVVHLDQPIDQEIDILIGQRVAFRGHMGRVDDALGVQITRPV
jgi:flagellar motor switch protein FliM